MDHLVGELHLSIKTALGDNLLGFYVFGSLVGGDFNPKTSDVDLLAIMRHDLSTNDLEDLRIMHDSFVSKHPGWQDRIEVAYVSCLLYTSDAADE